MRQGFQEGYMRMAIKEAYKNLKTMDGGPFGACIVRGKEILAVSRNMVLRTDATSHAEINAIRAASRKLNTFNLDGCVIYSTTEPCPMCFSAIHWARINVIVYGTGIKDARSIGFNELNISSIKLKQLGKSRIKIFPGVLYEDCVELLQAWGRLENKILY